MPNGLFNFAFVNRSDGFKIAAKQFVESHQTRVLSDGGVLPSLINLQNFIHDLLKAKGNKSISDLLLVADPHLTGYKTGTTISGCSKIYSINSNTDLIQTSGVTQPLLLPYNEERYLTNRAVAGNSFQIAKTVNNGINGTADFEFYFKLKMRSTVNTNCVIGSWLVGKRNLYIAYTGLANRGKLSINWSTNGSVFNGVQFSAKAFDDSVYYWHKISRVSNVLTHDWSSDGINWSNNYTGALTDSIYITDQPWYIMSSVNITELANGDLAFLQAKKNGNVVIDINPNTYNSNTPNSFTSAITNEPVTITRAATGYNANVITRNAIECDGVGTFLQSTYSFPTDRTDYVLNSGLDSEITTVSAILGKKNNAFTHHFGGFIASFEGYHSTEVQNKIKVVLNNYLL